MPQLICSALPPVLASLASSLLTDRMVEPQRSMLPMRVSLRERFDQFRMAWYRAQPATGVAKKTGEDTRLPGDTTVYDIV